MVRRRTARLRESRPTPWIPLRIGLYADIFNVFDKSYVNAVQQRVPSRTVEGFDVVYGAPASIVAPRQLTLGARWSF